MSLKSDEEHYNSSDRLIDGQVMYVRWDTGGPGGGFTYVSQMGKRPTWGARPTEPGGRMGVHIFGVRKL